MKRIFGFLFFAFFANAYPQGPALPSLPYVRYEAEAASYNLKDESIHLKNNVRIYEHTTSTATPSRVFKGDEFYIYPSSTSIVAKGRVFAQEGLDSFYAEDLKLNWFTKEGSFGNAQAWYGNWRVLKSSAAKVEGGEYIYDGAYITSCDKDEPDFRIHLGHLSVIPNDRIYGTNAVFYLGKIPFFYLPVLYQNTGTSNSYITYVDPAYDDRLGLSIQTTTVYKFNQHFTGRLFADYFTKQNFGGGLGFDYYNHKIGNASLASYIINEPGIGLNNLRWGLTGGYWFGLKGDETGYDKGDSLYYMQGASRMMSDPEFNNDYFRSNPYAVSPDETMSAAFVRQSKYTTTRIFYEQVKQQLEKNGGFVKTKEVLPQIDFNTSSFALPLIGPRILNTVTANFKNLKTNTENYFQPQGNVEWRVKTSLDLLNGYLTFMPEVFYNESAVFSTSKGYNEDQWVGRTGGSAAFRVNSAIGATDVGYSYTMRFSTNTMRVALSDDDRGEEVSRINFTHYYSPAMDSYFVLNTAYDLRYLRSEPSRTFENRLFPVNLNFIYTGIKNWTLLFNDQYQTGVGNQSLGFFASYGEFESGKPNLGLGFTNNREEPNHYVVTANAGLFPKNASWGIDLRIGVDFIADPDDSSKIETLALFRKEAILYKNFHDFETIFAVKFRPGVQSFAFKVGLRFNDRTERKPLAGEQRMNYPWRTDNESLLDM